MRDDSGRDVPWICTARRSWRDAWICRAPPCRWIGFERSEWCPECGAQAAHVVYCDYQALRSGVETIARRAEYRASLARFEQEWKPEPLSDREFD